MSESNSDRTADALQTVTAAVEARRLTASAARNLSRWLSEPQFARYAPRLLDLVDGDEFEELDAAFWEVIPFGTGGRRGPMGEFGTATINDRTIAESAHGLAQYVRRQAATDGRDTQSGALRAVVAHDTRIRSPEFARLTATTLAAHGFHVFFFESHRATPELSFAVRHLDCDCGAMISASHNPPADNGFKAYWAGGAQVLDPHDAGIIACVYEAGAIPEIDFDAAVASGAIEVVGAAVDDAYVAAVAALALSDAREIPAIFTPLHGVGETAVFRVAERTGFRGVTIFEPHRAPDGRFPNVPDHLPNPERTQVFAPVIAAAQGTDAELILASDPDADRLGVCVRDARGAFRHLTGNQVGALLTDYVLRRRQAQGTLTPAHYVVETLVTTPLIAAIARSFGVRAIDDLLVGFKYIARTMDREGPDRFVFGAEESLGYLAGEHARDKDAAVAALYVLELAAELRLAGKTLLDRLDELAVEHGYFIEGQRSESRQGPTGKEQIDRLMARLRSDPPRELAGFRLARARDYQTHEIRELPSNAKVAALPEPSGELVIFETAPGPRQFTIAARPSGTEPKIKFYFFGRADCAGAAELPALKTNVDAEFVALQDAWSAWVRQ